MPMIIGSGAVEDGIGLQRVELPIELQKTFHGLCNTPLFYISYCKKLNADHKVQRRVVLCTLDHVYVCHPNGDILRCFPFFMVERILHDPVRQQLALIVPDEYDVAMEVPNTYHFIDVIERLRALRPETSRPLVIQFVLRTRKDPVRDGLPARLLGYPPTALDGEDADGDGAVQLDETEFDDCGATMLRHGSIGLFGGAKDASKATKNGSSSESDFEDVFYRDTALASTFAFESTMRGSSKNKRSLRLRSHTAKDHAIGNNRHRADVPSNGNQNFGLSFATNPDKRSDGGGSVGGGADLGATFAFADGSNASAAMLSNFAKMWAQDEDDDDNGSDNNDAYSASFGGGGVSPLLKHDRHDNSIKSSRRGTATTAANNTAAGRRRAAAIMRSRSKLEANNDDDDDDDEGAMEMSPISNRNDGEGSPASAARNRHRSGTRAQGLDDVDESMPLKATSRTKAFSRLHLPRSAAADEAMLNAGEEGEGAATGNAAAASNSLGASSLGGGGFGKISLVEQCRDWWYYFRQAVPIPFFGSALADGVIKDWNDKFYKNPDASDRVKRRQNRMYKSRYDHKVLFQWLFWRERQAKVRMSIHNPLMPAHEEAIINVQSFIDDDPFVFGENVAGQPNEVCIGKGAYTVRLGKPVGWRLCLYKGAAYGGDEDEFELPDDGE